MLVYIKNTDKACTNFIKKVMVVIDNLGPSNMNYVKFISLEGSDREIF